MIILAYAFEARLPEGVIEKRLCRIQSYCSQFYATPLHQFGRIGPKAGIVVLKQDRQACRWPFWVSDGAIGIATGYVPFGSNELLTTAARSPEQEAILLGRSVLSHAGVVDTIDPPFSIFVIDEQAQKLTVQNDGLGYARLLKMEQPGGVVFSNHLGAMPILLNAKATMARDAWGYAAAAGWFMGDSTPVEGVVYGSPGSVFTVEYGDGLAVRHGSLRCRDKWLAGAGTGFDESRANAAADHLTWTFKRMQHLWADPPVIHLSGGRDSRMLAATAFAAGIDVSFVTHDRLHGEVETVEHLKSRLPRAINHSIVSNPRVRRNRAGPLRERASALLLRHDGMGILNDLRPEWPGKHSTVGKPSITGCGGELAHGHYYPKRGSAAEIRFARKARQSGDLRGLIADHLCRKVVQHSQHGGASQSSLHLVRDVIEQTLAWAEARHVHDFTMFDAFYLKERLRRWNNASSNALTVAPLVCVPYIQAAISLRPEERYDNLLPRRLIARAVPEWADCPFYSTTKSDQDRIEQWRIWYSDDRDDYEQIIFGDASWHEQFDPEAIQALWMAAREGGGLPKHEVLFRRVIWRACYQDHLDQLNELRDPMAMST